MNDLAQLPSIMMNAREDLAGNVRGQFSPEDWEKILEQAAAKFLESAKPANEAWDDVIRDFHRANYWGFIPNYVKPKIQPPERNLGKRFIWYCARSFLITKVVILYAGARYSADYEPFWGWIFFGAIAFMVTSYGIFIWRYGRGRNDEISSPANSVRSTRRP